MKFFIKNKILIIVMLMVFFFFSFLILLNYFPEDNILKENVLTHKNLDIIGGEILEISQDLIKVQLFINKREFQMNKTLEIHLTHKTNFFIYSKIKNIDKFNVDLKNYENEMKKNPLINKSPPDFFEKKKINLKELKIKNKLIIFGYFDESQNFISENIIVSNFFVKNPILPN